MTCSAVTWTAFALHHDYQECGDPAALCTLTGNLLSVKVPLCSFHQQQFKSEGYEVEVATASFYRPRALGAQAHA